MFAGPHLLKQNHQMVMYPLRHEHCSLDIATNSL
jgi:hypothetical protein